MDRLQYHNHLSILRQELQVALGCTEPIAIAYASAKAREILGCMPTSCLIQCSGNIVKNVKGVVVPNSGGLRGIEVAAILGIAGGKADKELAVLTDIREEHRILTRELLKQHFCTCELIAEVENLYIVASVTGPTGNAVVEIRGQHNNITRISKNGVDLFRKEAEPTSPDSPCGDPEQINLASIIEFADHATLDELRPILHTQIEYNCAISHEGLQGTWGVQAGKTLLSLCPHPDVRTRSRAAAAAGSDARMNGCALPVVINCGSGNQGITVTMPIVTYAQEYQIEEPIVLKALALANLLAVHQKKYIGRLSAYCGVVSAATASACGVAYMLHYQTERNDLYNILSNIITNSICTIGGMVCDGAKSSCATKISIAVENALMAMELAVKGNVFQPGEGLTMSNVEETISAVGRMGREGMHTTDIEILNIMLGH